MHKRAAGDVCSDGEGATALVATASPVTTPTTTTAATALTTAAGSANAMCGNNGKDGDGSDDGCASCCCCLCCCGATLEHFRQQRLPAWSPLLTPRYVARWLLVLALLMGVLAVLTTALDRRAYDVHVRYDHLSACTPAHHHSAFAYTVTSDSDSNDNNGSRSDSNSSSATWTYRTGCVTDVRFALARPMRAPVYVYYGLTRLHQSHRRFATSVSAHQMAGDAVGPAHELLRTSPLARPGELPRPLSSSPLPPATIDTRLRIGERVYRYGACLYAPAGIVPWSMFNDSFTLYRVDNNNSNSNNNSNNRHSAVDDAADGIASHASRETWTLLCNGSAFSRATNAPLPDGPHANGRGCHKRGIAWHTDVAARYRPLRPPPPLQPPPPPPHADARPRDHDERCVWSAPKQRDYGWPAERAPTSNDSYYNEGWYAGEPGHRLPVTTDEDLMVWARPATMPSFRKLYRVLDVDLPAGEYVMRVDEHYDVSRFGGTKSFVLATTTWKGGRNAFLSWLYIALTVCAAVGAVALLLIAHHFEHRAYDAMAHLLRKA